MITISTALLDAITKWSYPDADRPWIACVLFDLKHVVATDTNRLVRVPIDNDGPKFTVRREHLFAAVAAARELNSTQISLETIDKCVEIGLGHFAVMTVTRGPDGFPDPACHKVIPADSTVGSPLHGYCINSRYLAAVDEVHHALGGGSREGVRVAAWGGALDPIKLLGAGGSEFVIMPMRWP